MNTKQETTSSLIAVEVTSSSSTDRTSSSPSLYTPPFTGQLVLFFRCLVIVIGILGSAMNGIVFKVLLSKKLRSKASNILIINQVLLDLLSCLSLITCYAVKIPFIYLNGGWGYFVCIIFTSDTIIYFLQSGSIVNLVLIAVERYLKIVHLVVHRKYFRKWMTYVGIGFTWISGIVVNAVVTWTSAVSGGQCYSYYYWSNDTTPAILFAVFTIFWQFILPFLLFVYFYGRILYVVRKQSRVFQGTYTNQDMANALQSNAHRSQMNVVTTMITISVAFVVCWFPNEVFFFLETVGYNMQNGTTIYYATVFLVFLNVCMNPFIYAAKHEAIRESVIAMFLKRNTSTATRSEVQTSNATR